MSTDAFLSMFMGPGHAAQPDPVKAAQAGMKAQLTRRFYQSASVIEKDGLHHIALDGRVARTPARQPLALRSPQVAAAMAAEWQRQGQVIDPASMPLTRLANAAIDGVAHDPQAVRDEILRYAGSDLVCYRADEPEPLAARQSAAWDPVVAFARERLGARLRVATGIVHFQQDVQALTALARAIDSVEAPLPLAALSLATSLAGSALIALALTHRELDLESAWAAATVDETYQAGIWGRDEEAVARLDERRRNFAAAAFVLTGSNH